jgi:hypothetical protein
MGCPRQLLRKKPSPAANKAIARASVSRCNVNRRGIAETSDHRLFEAIDDQTEDIPAAIEHIRDGG